MPTAPFIQEAVRPIEVREEPLALKPEPEPKNEWAPQTEAAPASPRENRPNYALALLLAVPIIGIAIFAVSQGRPAATANPVVTNQGTTSPSAPPSLPSEPAPAPLPTIESLGADPVAETSTGWNVVIRWKVRDASRTVIAWEGMTDDDHPTKFSDQAVVDPDLGEKQIDLLGPRATVTLTAYNQDDKKVVSTVMCSVPRAASTPDPVEETNPHLIPTLETTHRSDTPEGTVFRVAYKALLTEDVHFEMGGEVIPLDPNDDAIALFVSRRTKLILRAKGGGEEATKELILAPDPKVATEPERQQEGPPLSDHLDVISVIASQMDLSLIEPSDSGYEAIYEWFLTWRSSAGETEYMQARNAICARHGYIFQTRPELQTLFGSRRWYRGDTSDGKVLGTRFNALEKKNIAWLKAREEEQARNAKYHDG